MEEGVAQAKKQKFFFAVGPFCWGRGKTQEEAVANVKREWSRSMSGNFKAAKLAIYETEDEDAYIDPMDGTLWASRGSTRQIQKSSLGRK